MSDKIRKLQRGLSAAADVPDAISDLVRQLSAKKAGSFTGIAGGGKQAIDRANIISSHILGGQGSRDAIRQAWQQLPRESQATIMQEIGSRYAVAGQPTSMTPEGQFMIDFLNGRAEVSPQQLDAIKAADAAAETGAGLNASSSGMTFTDSGQPTDLAQTFNLDGGLDGAAKTDLIDPDLAVPDTPTSTSAQNPLSGTRGSLQEKGILRNKFDTKEPFRVDTETDLAPGMVDGQQRMIPVTTPTEGGTQLGRTEKGMINRAEKGLPVNEATDFQAQASNSNPQAIYDQQVMGLINGGGGTAEGVWKQLAGPNAASTLRFNFESPREAAEAMASMLTADIGAARTGGGISAGQIQEMTKGKLYPGMDENTARQIAQTDMGLETSGVGQSRKGMEAIVEDLERIITKEVGGSGWGVEARAAAEAAGGAGLPPVPKDTTPKVTPDPGLEGEFASGQSLGDPDPSRPATSSSSSSSTSEVLDEVPKKTQSLDASLESVSLEQARRKSWDAQASRAAMDLGLPESAAADPPRVIEAQMKVLSQSDTPEAAQQIQELSERLENAKRIAAYVEGPYGKRSKQLRYKPNPSGYKTKREVIKGIKSASSPEQITDWGNHIRDGEYSQRFTPEEMNEIRKTFVEQRTKVGAADATTEGAAAKPKEGLDQTVPESKPSDLDNAMPEGENITPDPEVVTPADNTPPKVDPEPEVSVEAGRQKGSTRVVDEPAAGDGNTPPPPKDKTANAAPGDDPKKPKETKADKTPTQDPPKDPLEGEKKPGFVRRLVGNKWTWIAAAGAAALSMNRPSDPNAPTDDMANGGSGISPEVMAAAQAALAGEGGGEEEESGPALIRKLRARRDERHERAKSLRVNPNTQTNANWIK